MVTRQPPHHVSAQHHSSSGMLNITTTERPPPPPEFDEAIICCGAQNFCLNDTGDATSLRLTSGPDQSVALSPLTIIIVANSIEDAKLKCDAPRYNSEHSNDVPQGLLIYSHERFLRQEHGIITTTGLSRHRDSEQSIATSKALSLKLQQLNSGEESNSHQLQAVKHITEKLNIRRQLCNSVFNYMFDLIPSLLLYSFRRFFLYVTLQMRIVYTSHFSYKETMASNIGGNSFVRNSCTRRHKTAKTHHASSARDTSVDTFMGKHRQTATCIELQSNVIEKDILNTRPLFEQYGTLTNCTIMCTATQSAGGFNNNSSSEVVVVPLKVKRDIGDAGQGRLHREHNSASNTTRYSHKGIMPIVFLILTMLFATGSCQDSAELCVVEDPLETPYLTPLLEGAAVCSLCRTPSPTELYSTSPSDGSRITSPLLKETPISQAFIVDHTGPALGLPTTTSSSSRSGYSSTSGTETVAVTVALTGLRYGHTYGLLLHATSPRHSFTVTASTDDDENNYDGAGGGDNGANLVILSSSSVPVHMRSAKVSCHYVFLNESVDATDGAALSRAAATVFGVAGLYISTVHANLVSIDVAATLGSSRAACKFDTATGSYENRTSDGVEGGLPSPPSAGPESEGVVCRRQATQHLSGCYHHHMIGTHMQDIHIIDVQGSGNSNGSLVLEVHGQTAAEAEEINNYNQPYNTTRGSGHRVFSGGAYQSSGPTSNDNSKTTKNNPNYSKNALTGSTSESDRKDAGSWKSERELSATSKSSSNNKRHYSMTDVVQRNITLVLRSVRPVTWLVRPTSIHGTITVLLVGDGQIENGSSAHYGRHADGVTVVTKTKNMPHSFDQFFLTVLSTVGYPISYTNSTVPNKIVVTVPVTNGFHPASNARQELQVYQHREDALALIQEELVVLCAPHQVVVALPSWAADRAQSDGMLTLRFSDPACESHSNGSHVVLTAPYTDCGFNARTHYYSTTYVNYIRVSLGSSSPAFSDDEDLAGSGFGADDDDLDEDRASSDLLRVTCDVATGSRHHAAQEGAPLYWLEVFESNSQNITSLVGLTPSSPARVERGDVLHVVAGLYHKMGGSRVQVVLEECWFEEDTTTPAAAQLSPPSPSSAVPITSSTSSVATAAADGDPQGLLQSQQLRTTSRYSSFPETSSLISTSHPEHVDNTQENDLHPAPALSHFSSKSIDKTKENADKSLRNSLPSKNSLSESVFDDDGFKSSKEAATRLELVRKSCAMQPSVVVNHLTASFTFTVGATYDVLSRAMLKCRVGICSASSLPKPPLNKCIKPSSYCKKSELLRVFDDQPAASSLQTVSLGPLLFNQQQHGDGATKDATARSSQQEPVLVMQGVPTEMVVLISFASFVVGVAVTGLLWFLHSRQGCSRGCKSGLRSLEQQAPTGCAAGNSGGSTPSSQAPMTGGA